MTPHCCYEKKHNICGIAEYDTYRYLYMYFSKLLGKLSLGTYIKLQLHAIGG